ncbi:MAG: MBL fold metallo-hydrolase [Marinilabiliaceae bacterium]|nr:MBL fold metallo-hydrolase [Marinilabiliaceae bacterium]
MKLSILTENTAGGKFKAEHGLSYLIEYDEQKILFDTGHSDVFIKNASQLGIDIQSAVDTVVLSHGHWDHGDGLRYIENKTLITHPGAFIKRYRRNGQQNIGLAISNDELGKKFNVITTSNPYSITPNIIYLGSIPRDNNFEAQSTSFVDEKQKDDFVPDDSALAIKYNNELVLISGCAHAGICNTIEYAKKVSGLTRIKAVIGGFHLKSANKQTNKTIDYLRSNSVELLYPSHCTELPALAAFYNAFQINQLKTGMTLNF